jgi:hypothetical protein
MASFSNLKQRVMLAIPPDQRPLEEKGVESAIKSSIEAISSIYRWSWRERSTAISLTVGTETYSMPKQCDMISGKDGIFLDSNSNPTGGRIVMMTEYMFNQRYIETNTEDATETTGRPEYYVPLVDLDNLGCIQLRFFPSPDKNRTAKMYFYEAANDNDLANQCASLVYHSVMADMGRFIGDLTNNHFYQYKDLLKELKPQDIRAASKVSLRTQNPRREAHNLDMKTSQGSR